VRIWVTGSDRRTEGTMKNLAVVSIVACTLLAGCETQSPLAPQAATNTLTTVSGSSVSNSASAAVKPNFNLEVILRAPNDGDAFGHVKFRQANDAATVIDLGVWVRDLSPNTHYRLQRAVDTVIDDQCTSTSWLTLGKGLVAQDLITDDTGTAREDLFRVITSPPGGAFDIRFRVVTTAASPVVVLASDCYQFFIR
jgi:hypothetical protein